MTDIAALVEQLRILEIDQNGTGPWGRKTAKEAADALERLQRERDAAIGANSAEQPSPRCSCRE